MLLDGENDSYYISLVAEKHRNELKKLHDVFWKFNTFGSRTGEILYTVNCSCGSMNIWHVCQDCGKALIDKAGNASLPVIKDYI